MLYRLGRAEQTAGICIFLFEMRPYVQGQLGRVANDRRPVGRAHPAEIVRSDPVVNFDRPGRALRVGRTHRLFSQPYHV
ncbi:hypothetical protein D3C80_2031860 [compost metagenome]